MNPWVEDSDTDNSRAEVESRGFGLSVLGLNSCVSASWK